MKNGYRSHNGRSAVARKAIFSATGHTNGMFPQIFVITSNGERVRGGYFGGMKKGGSQPSGTGFMTPSHSSAATQVAYKAEKPNFLFKFYTNPGPVPFGHRPYAGL